MTDDTKPRDLIQEAKKAPWITTGVAVGVGSAALVAALLYANRGKDKPSKEGVKKR